MQEVGHGADLIRLVDEPDGGTEVVERRAGRKVAAPQLGGVAETAVVEAVQVSLEPVGQSLDRTPHALHEQVLRIRAQGELGGRQQRRRGDGAGAALIGRVEGPQGIDLVAEPLDADGHGLARREDVDDAAAARELTTTADLGHVLVAEIDERAGHARHVESLAHSQLQRFGGDIARRQRALEEGLQAGHQDARGGAFATPFCERRHACRRLVPHQLGAFVGQGRTRLQRDDVLGTPQPGGQLFGYAVRDLGVTGDPVPGAPRRPPPGPRRGRSWRRGAWPRR